MGRYLNVTNKGFRESLQSKIYVDKSGIIAFLNGLIDTEQKYICVSRPRRFGKSMTVKMLSAYYNNECDSENLFSDLKISQDASYREHLNKYDVIWINMQDFMGNHSDVETVIGSLNKSICRELQKKYDLVEYTVPDSLADTMYDIFLVTEKPFIILIDEWDCLFRERKGDAKEQKKYLDFLRSLMKDKPYIGLAYMTGILPIKKYGTHSALNMFDEYSMTDPRELAEFVGFTAKEVQALCDEFNMEYEETKYWYNGYSFPDAEEVYSPKSLISAMTTRRYSDYWNQTETFEALSIYIQMNYDGLKDKVVEMIAGARTKINIGNFTNDMTTFHTSDDILTLLIHLGYLAYDLKSREVYIPNKEIEMEFLNSVNAIGWDEVITAVEDSEKLLRNLWEGNENAVASGIEKVHQENSSILQYNDENALSCVIDLALYAAQEYYMKVREFPSGKGFADIVYLPRKKYADKPAMIVELKWNKDAQSALRQIYERCYPAGLKGYQGEVLIAGINYDKDTKAHDCKIEKMIL